MAWGLSLATSESQNPGGNTSTVSATLYLTWSNANRYSGFTTSGAINIGGNVMGFTGPTSGGSAAQTGSQVLASHSVTFTHSDTGFRGAVGTSASFDASGTNTIAPQNLSTSGTTFGAIDYDRRPGTPTFNTIARTGNSIAITVNSTTSPASGLTYYVDRSQNGGAFGDQRTGQNVTYSGLTLGTTQQFRTYASNADGTGGSTTSTSYSIPNVPSAPASINVTSTSPQDIRVTVGASTSNGGDTVPLTYKLQYEKIGTPGFSSFVTVTPGVAHVYTDLEPGQTYVFRAFATNSVGDSSVALSSSFLVTAGGKRWDGTSFVTVTNAQRWDGSQWIFLTNTKRWNGTQWVNLS